MQARINKVIEIPLRHLPKYSKQHPQLTSISRIHKYCNSTTNKTSFTPSRRHRYSTTSTIISSSTTSYRSFSIATACYCYFAVATLRSLIVSGEGNFTTKTFSASAFSSNSMSSHITTRDGNGIITVAPRDESKQSALIVISHGLGDSAEGFVDVAEQLSTAMPYCKFILPTAPTQPVTMNMGMPMPSWYDIVGLDERSNENCNGIDKSRSTLHTILKNEHDRNGLAYSRMVLMGFSQGGALSLFSGLSLPSKELQLAGIVVLSGYLAGGTSFQLTDGLKNTPIFHGHGTSDPMVMYTMATKTQATLQSMGVSDYVLKPYQGVQHTISQQEIRDVMEFLKKKLPEDKNQCVRVKDPGEMSVKELKAAIRNAGLGSRAVGLMEKSEFVKLVREYRES